MENTSEVETETMKNLRKLLKKEVKNIFYENQTQTKESLNVMLDDYTVLSGSFNPLHEGHIKLCQAAHSVSKKNNMLFELSIHNADKGDVGEQQILDRINQFKEAKLNLLVT